MTIFGRRAESQGQRKLVLETTQMPTIAYIGSIQIRIYYDGQGVTHFHAVSPDFDFKIATADCSVISGNGRLRGRDLAAIREWGRRHRDALYLNWQRDREGEPLRDIED
jgi:hypothetical protein